MSHKETWVNINSYQGWIYMPISPLDSVNCDFFKGKCYILAILLSILTLFLVDRKHSKSKEN